MSNDFSSDKILESYRELNEISWRDQDVCSECGRYIGETGDCLIDKCPFEEKINLEEDEN